MLEKFIGKPCEDSLTASVFSHLLHLPIEDFWRILQMACFSDKFPDNPGEPICIHAWPKWSALGTRNSERVIPDLVIEFHAFDLIVEAKRWDVPMQDEDQWNSELIAYTNEYGAKKHEVRMIALGGIHSHKDHNLEYEWSSNDASELPDNKDKHTFKCPVYMCQWSTLLHACQKLKRKYEEKNKTNPTSRTSADMRILDDLIAFFATHGFTALQWFEDFDFKPNLLDAWADSDQQFFQKRQLPIPIIIMNSNDKPTHDVFLNVRKAYRLLHDYQRWMLDGVRYIESQLDIQYKGVWSKSNDEDFRSGYTKLDQSSWTWLPTMMCEFYFVKAVKTEWLQLSLFIISDTGWIEGDVKERDYDVLSAYLWAEKSSSKFIFILRKTNEEQRYFPFTDDKKSTTISFVTPTSTEFSIM